NATSSPPRKILPELGSSSPAIILSVVVLPQPEGPSRQKKDLSGMVKLRSFTAVNSPNFFCRFCTRISAMGLIRKFRNDDEHDRPEQSDREGIAVERQREGLQQHEHAERDEDGRQVFPRASAKAQKSREQVAHLRTAPKVMPRRRCLRSSTVNTRIGIRN